MERLTERDSNGTNFLVCREGCNGGPACFECEQKAIDRLAAYEDFVERWKLTSIEDASRIFRRINALGGTDLMGQYRDLGPINHLRRLVQAEKDGRLVVLPPNDPLTLEELLKMDGEPIWVVFKEMNVNPSWYIVNTKCEEAANKNGGFVPMVYYGYTWLAYRRRSEEV